MDFNYSEFVQRNLGFVNEAEQQRLREASILCCGVGGMGGACLQSLVRAGVGNIVVADFDVFEVSNMNRQVFANLDTVGVGKTEATMAQLRRINPELNIRALGAEWPEQLDELLARHKVVINGMDDLAAGLALYRKAKEHGATVVDAYTAPLPSVFVTAPADPRPEERLSFPSLGRDWRTLPQDVRQACFGKEIEYVLVHSSAAHHVDLDVAKGLLAGTRKRMSFAPMVITTGNLMAFEVIKLLLGRPHAGPRGYFFNPWAMAVEKPHGTLVAALRRFLVRRFIDRLMRG
jgi:molybdopterin/thiamine biosynthesis adenylyltransferase